MIKKESEEIYKSKKTHEPKGSRVYSVLLWLGIFVVSTFIFQMLTILIKYIKSGTLF